jgi:hypothetical protein
MRHRNRLIYFWLLAMLLLDMAFLAYRVVRNPIPNEIYIAANGFLAVLFSQTGMLTIWIVWGRRAVLRRVFIGIFWILFSGAMLKMFILNYGPDFPLLCILLLTQMTITLGLFGISTIAGWRLQQLAGAGALLKEKAPLLQYTLRNLLSWMTAAAVILGLLQSLLLWGIRFEYPHKQLFETMVFGALNALPLFSTLWVVNGQYCATFRGIQLFAVLGILGFVVISFHPADRIYLAGIFALEFLLSAGSLLVFRLAGFRLVRCRVTTAGGNEAA